MSQRELGAISPGIPRIVAEPLSLARYQAIRDQLSSQLFDITERVASYAWGLDEIRSLLQQVSSAVIGEVKHLQYLPSPRTSKAHVVGKLVRC